MSLTQEEIEAVTEKISAMAAAYGLELSETQAFKTEESQQPARSFGSPTARKRVVHFSVKVQLLDKDWHPLDMTIEGAIDSTVTLAETTIDQVAVYEPEALKSRQKV